MTSRTAHRPRPRTERRALERAQRKEARRAPHRTHAGRRLVVWLVALAAVGAVVSGLLLSARPTQQVTATTAPSFELTSTDGGTASLDDFRGESVLLYFNEGVGCDACFSQMVEIERSSAKFRRAGLTVLPVVMNPVQQVRAELARFGIRTPYLVDKDGSVSKEYGVLGKGMHAGLPGHSFVLVDGKGRKRWSGEYPSMFLPADELMRKVERVTG